jgi:hypothetical protein
MFKSRNINISKGNSSRRNILSTVQFNLSNFLFFIGVYFESHIIYSSFDSLNLNKNPNGESIKIIRNQDLEYVKLFNRSSYLVSFILHYQVVLSNLNNLYLINRIRNYVIETNISNKLNNSSEEKKKFKFEPLKFDDPKVKSLGIKEPLPGFNVQDMFKNIHLENNHLDKAALDKRLSDCQSDLDLILKGYSVFKSKNLGKKFLDSSSTESEILSELSKFNTEIYYNALTNLSFGKKDSPYLKVNEPLTELRKVSFYRDS